MSLKTITKNIGFKYVWHRHGRFLARVKEGLPVRVFESVSDLRIIANNYSHNSHQNSTNTQHNNINTPQNTLELPVRTQSIQQ